MTSDELDAARSLFSRICKTGNFIGGEDVEEFERNFASYCGVGHAVAVNSGTDALILALKAAGVGRGDQVLTVSNSFISTANAIRWTGAEAVFVDIGHDLLMSPEKLAEAVTARTKAVLPVHLTGLPCAMDMICDVAREYDLVVIEDAAQSAGALFKGRKTGSFGDIGCFSLHPLKTLGGIGDGGILTTGSAELARSLRLLRNNGLIDRDTVGVIGVVSRLDTINAAVLNGRLARLDEMILERRRRADLYRQGLEEVGEVVCPADGEGRRHAYHTYVILADERDRLLCFLRDNGVEAKIHYPTLIHHQPPYRAAARRLPMTEALNTKILSLPIASVSDSEITHVCGLIRQFYRARHRAV